MAQEKSINKQKGHAKRNTTEEIGKKKKKNRDDFTLETTKRKMTEWKSMK